MEGLPVPRQDDRVGGMTRHDWGYNDGPRGPVQVMRTKIGKYVLKRKLGTGASSVVWLAHDEFSGRDVAVKCYETADAAGLSGTARAQFLNETALVGRLRHPHIAAILDASIDENNSYIVTEFVPGGCLDVFGQDAATALPLTEVVEIGFKCAGALDYAYRNDVIHRDIKPANILRVEGSNVKIADFGAAFIRNAESTQIMDIGTPSYAAPEQAQGRSLTHHSDMFSLGVVLYELLARQRPFRGADNNEVLRKLVSDDPEPLARLRPDLPRSLADIVVRAMQKNPADRYLTWTDFALDLARAGGLSFFNQDVADSEKFTALKSCPLLADLGDSEIWEFVAIGKWSRVPAHHFVVREGETGNSMFLLAGGEAKVTLSNRLLNLLSAGEWFGEQPYVHGRPVAHQASVQTTADSVLVEFKCEALENLGDRSKQRFTLALLRALAERLSLSNVRISRMG